jgi:hypothetical protein
MRRTLFLVVVPLVLISIAAFILLAELPRGSEPATVYLKPGLVQGDMREGEVTKKDKYVEVNSGGKQEVFTWDQVRYISAEGKNSSPTRLDRVIDLVELLSKLSIAASLIVFSFGLYQYYQGQKWKREEFLAAAVKEFSERASVSNARRMIDSLALYPDGREIKLFPDEEKPEDRTVFVSNEEIYDALTVAPGRLDKKAKEIRECFDGFLGYLEGFYHYLEQRLITKEALMSNVGYWIILLGTGDDLSCAYKRRIFAYADKYKFTEVELLVRKYYQKFDWRKLPCSAEDRRTRDADTPAAAGGPSRPTSSKPSRGLVFGIFAGAVLIRAWFGKKRARGKRPRP